jgi:hypothetical protein
MTKVAGRIKVPISELKTQLKEQIGFIVLNVNSLIKARRRRRRG